MQVALVGFLTGGSFLGLANWDVPYSIVCFMVLARVVVQRELARAPAPAPRTGLQPAALAVHPPRLPA
jgi:hypothetical protein